MSHKRPAVDKGQCQLGCAGVSPKVTFRLERHFPASSSANRLLPQQLGVLLLTQGLNVSIPTAQPLTETYIRIVCVLSVAGA
jgi:hypothetical protein